MDRQPDEKIRVGADEAVIRVPSAATGGALFAIEVRLAPGGGPAALHRHAADEVVRVDRGELALYLEGADGGVERRAARAGDVAHLPGGRLHTVRNESGAEALAFTVFAPGTDVEAFVRAAGALGAGGPPSAAAILALAERHGMQLGPPVAA